MTKATPSSTPENHFREDCQTTCWKFAAGWHGQVGLLVAGRATTFVKEEGSHSFCAASAAPEYECPSPKHSRTGAIAAPNKTRAAHPG